MHSIALSLFLSLSLSNTHTHIPGERHSDGEAARGNGRHAQLDEAPLPRYRAGPCWTLLDPDVAHANLCLSRCRSPYRAQSACSVSLICALRCVARALGALLLCRLRGCLLPASCCSRAGTFLSFLFCHGIFTLSVVVDLLVYSHETATFEFLAHQLLYLYVSCDAHMHLHAYARICMNK
jgi:hypothetical protein